MGKGAGEEEGEPEEGSRARSRETLVAPVPLGDFRFSISLPFGIRELCDACAPAERSGNSARRLLSSSRATGQAQAHREHRAQISRELHSKPSVPSTRPLLASFFFPLLHFSPPETPPLPPTVPPANSSALVSPSRAPESDAKASLVSAAPPQALWERVGGGIGRSPGEK